MNIQLRIHRHDDDPYDDDERGENEGTVSHAMMTIIRFNKLAEEGKSSTDKFSACTRVYMYSSVFEQ